MIPEQLKKGEFRFIKVKYKTKKGFEVGWSTTANYSYDNEDFLKHIEQENTYGVCTGYGNLIVIDSDHPVTQEKVLEHLPETFRVKTRKGFHNYFICKDLKKKIILDNDDMGVHYGEVMTFGQQVIGAGCDHAVEGKYEICDDKEIAEIKAEDIRFALRDVMIQKEEFAPTSNIQKSDISLDITSVVPMGGLKKQGNEYVGSHPKHGSSNGMNFSINPSKNTWHCFRHDTGGGAMMWIAVAEGIIDCSDARRGVLRGDLFNKTLKVAKEKYGLKTPEYDVEEVGWQIHSNAELKEKVILLKKAKEGNQAIELMVKQFLNKHNIYTIRDDKINELWIYNNGVYTPQGRTYILEFCRQVMLEDYSRTFANKVCERIEEDTYIDPQSFFNTNHADLMIVQNGMFNVVTRELMPLDPSKIFFAKTGVRYDTEAKCPTILKFFNDILKDESDIKIIQEIFGYCLYKELFIEKAFMLTGNTRNGKSKCMELLKYLLGHANCSSLSLIQITKDKFMRAGLFGKMANMGGDISSKKIENIELFKQITGRDTIEADRKYLTRLEFVVYAKLLFACNKMPELEENQEAFFQRWVLVDFPYTFLPQKEIDQLPKKERINVKLQDPDIIKKLTTPEELSGLLNWSLDGLDRLLLNKQFTNSRTSTELKLIWERKTDSLTAFISEYIEFADDDEVFIDKREFKGVYAHFCKTHNLKMKTTHEVKAYFDKINVYQKVIKDTNNSAIRVYEGLKFRHGTLDEKNISTLYYTK